MKTLAAIRQNLYIGLCFLFPFGILGLAYAAFGVYPFGDKTILISDMSGQYLDFYSAFYELLSQGKSLFYSWEAGMGLSFIGIYAYYLASPFSFLILLFAKEQLPEALLLITLLKVGSAGLAFSFYARFKFQGPKAAILGFSVIYALMSYTIVYAFNLMWLDGIILLPLVLLGIEKLIHQNQFLLLGLSLWLLYITNFYIAYMIGLFSFFYFLLAYSTTESLKNYQQFLRRLWQFLGTALLSAGAAAFILIPTFFALSNGPNTVDPAELLEYKINFPLFDLLPKFLLGSYDSLTLGLPNIATSLLPLLLLPLFVLNTRISFKERAASLTLLIFLLVGFNLWNLNIIWHALDIPDWFPYRYSFLFSFLVILLAFKAFKSLQPSDLPRVLKTYGFLFLMILVLQKFNYPYLSPKVIFINLVFLSAYVLVLALIIQRPEKGKLLTVLLLSLILFEGFFNSWYLLRRLDSQFLYVTKDKYAEKLVPMQTLIQAIQQTDPGFYRLERVDGRTQNDALNLGYRGIAHFSSMSNGNLHQFFKQLGFAVWADNKVLSYSGSTLVTDSLFGVKYKISSDPPGFGNEQRFKTTGLDQAYYLYENAYVLPLGFMTDKELLNLDITTKNPFELQNALLNLSLGIPADSPFFVRYFASLPVYDVTLENITLTTVKGKSYYEKINPNREGFIRYTLPNQNPQQVYFALPPGMSLVKATLNDKQIGDFSQANRIIDLGFYEKDEDLELTLRLGYSNFPYSPNPFYALNTRRFASSLKTLERGSMQEIQVTGTSVTGKVKAQTNELLFTTIPFDAGWEVFVDGVKTPITKIANAFIGIELTPGTHALRLQFTPQGLTLGFIIMGLSFVLLLGLALRLSFTHNPSIQLKLTHLGGKRNFENEGSPPEQS